MAFCSSSPESFSIESVPLSDDDLMIWGDTTMVDTTGGAVIVIVAMVGG